MNHNATDDHDATARPERAIDNDGAWEDTRDLQAYATQTYGLDQTSVGQLIDWCEGAARAAGRPFARIIERRWDERGEPVGPDDRVGRDEAEIVLDVVEAVVNARSAALAAAIEPKAASAAKESPSAHRRGRVPSCDHGWCSMTAGVEHEEYHAGDPVDLAGAKPDLSAGWWGWLFENEGEHQPVMLTIEGHQHRGVDIPAAAAADFLAATATPEARQALVELLSHAGIEVSE